MGFSGMSVWSLLLILLIIVLLFGTKKLKTLGTDLGEIITGLKKGLQQKDGDEPVNTSHKKTEHTPKATQKTSQHKQS